MDLPWWQVCIGCIKSTIVACWHLLPPHEYDQTSRQKYQSIYRDNNLAYSQFLSAIRSIKFPKRLVLIGLSVISRFVLFKAPSKSPMIQLAQSLGSLLPDALIVSSKKSASSRVLVKTLAS